MPRLLIQHPPIYTICLHPETAETLSRSLLQFKHTPPCKYCPRLLETA
ncbi:hypothetical protein Patl1_12073 [Pistacia atlantica]|uniref:Uncharacterized protein n=1 Tax=Pistacia atlantica TaxID=434234 RepID=A0ACC1A7Q9_9ROSI|nr:hypothetical protein Patl1_12073 [Pistacia atlantica]